MQWQTWWMGVAAVATAVAAIASVVTVYVLWRQLRAVLRSLEDNSEAARTSSRAARASAYVSLRSALAQVNQNIIDKDELGTLVGEDRREAFQDLIASYYEMVFILHEEGLLTGDQLKAEKRSLDRLFSMDHFREHLDGLARAGVFHPSFLRYVRKALTERFPDS